MSNRVDSGVGSRVDYYYDIVCPYAYLGSTQIEAICARHGRTVRWRPILLGGVLKAIRRDPWFTTKLPAAKAKHNTLDALRWADHWGVPLTWNPGHPVRTVTTMRALVAAERAGLDAAPLVRALYRAYWAEGRMLDDEAVLADTLTAAGADGAGLVRQAAEPAIKAELRARTDEALSRGVFGVPATFVGDALYWGQDRLDFVERDLAAQPLQSSISAS